METKKSLVTLLEPIWKMGNILGAIRESVFLSCMERKTTVNLLWRKKITCTFQKGCLGQTAAESKRANQEQRGKQEKIAKLKAGDPKDMSVILPREGLMEMGVSFNPSESKAKLIEKVIHARLMQNDTCDENAFATPPWGSDWDGEGSTCRLSVKISLLCRLSVKIFDLCR